ncbi:LysE family translocator [Streptomyces winkii]|uniref:LysE family translocator n=1 Tax=Streptomyces winkii TaxID=3051178 RepID=UPI0028D0BFA7|nr:LysE family translocator [Streptomyces sp. DSM 40971]
MSEAAVVAFVIAVFLLSVAPGPDMMFIVANALAGGRKTGVVAALGVSAGLAVHTALAAFGLGALLRAAPYVLEVVRVCGALFLVYLAVTTWQASRQLNGAAESTLPAHKRSLRKVYVMAFLTNLANPKIIIFYLAFFPQFLTTSGGSWPVTLQFMVLGAIFIVVGLTVDASVGLLSGTLSEQVLRRNAVRRWLDRVSAAIFGGLAVRLVVDSAR